MWRNCNLLRLENKAVEQLSYRSSSVNQAVCRINVHENAIDDTTVARLVSECRLHRPARAATAGHTLHSNRPSKPRTSDPRGRLSV